MGNHGSCCQPFRLGRVDRHCCVVVSVFLLGKLASEHVPPTMVVSFQAIVSAPSMPNRSLLHVHRFGTSWRHDTWWQCRRRQWNRSRRSSFLLNVNEISCIDRSWRLPLSYDRHGAPLLAFKHTSILQHTMGQVGIIKTRKTIIINVYFLV